MYRPTARLITIIQNRKWLRCRIGVRPPGHRLAFCVWTQILPLEVPQFVLRAEVRGGQPWATLEANDFHARFAKLGCEYSAYRAHSDNDDISLFSCHSSCPLRYRPLQANDWRTCERLSALHIRPGEDRLGPREAHQAPTRKVLVAAVDRVGEHAFHGVRADGVEK